MSVFLVYSEQKYVSPEYRLTSVQGACLLKQTQETLVRLRFYAQCRPGRRSIKVLNAECLHKCISTLKLLEYHLKDSLVPLVVRIPQLGNHWPKCIASCVSRVDEITGFTRSSKYYLHCERISFSSMRMLPAESLMSKWHSIACLLKVGRSAKILYLSKNIWNAPNDQTLPIPLNFFTAEAAAFRASLYWDCKSEDDLPRNKALNASFFAQIASWTSWFHQGVLFSLFSATLSRFRGQH